MSHFVAMGAIGLFGGLGLLVLAAFRLNTTLGIVVLALVFLFLGYCSYECWKDEQKKGKP